MTIADHHNVFALTALRPEVIPGLSVNAFTTQDIVSVVAAPSSAAELFAPAERAPEMRPVIAELPQAWAQSSSAVVKVLAASRWV